MNKQKSNSLGQIPWADRTATLPLVLSKGYRKGSSSTEIFNTPLESNIFFYISSHTWCTLCEPPFMFLTVQSGRASKWECLGEGKEGKEGKVPLQKKALRFLVRVIRRDMRGSGFLHFVLPVLHFASPVLLHQRKPCRTARKLALRLSLRAHLISFCYSILLLLLHMVPNFEGEQNKLSDLNVLQPPRLFPHHLWKPCSGSVAPSQ